MLVTDYIYDIEAMLNLFSLTIMSADTGDIWVFEVSERRNDLPQLVEFVYWLRDTRARMVGFNNVGYDYPMLHFILMNYRYGLTVENIRAQNDKIIATPFNQRWDNHVAPWDVIVPQVDLYLIHRFDDRTRSTSLKQCEFTMRSDSVEELQLPDGFDTWLTLDQMQQTIDYNMHDVTETFKFYEFTKERIDFRDELTATYGKDFTNFSDAKIGKEFFTMKLEERSPGICFTKMPGQRRIARQTPRESIVLADIIKDYISFKRPEFQRVLEYMKQTTITQTKEPPELKDLTATVYGLVYHFGAGGIHASVDAQTVESTLDMVILDLDVSSYYPSLGIANHAYPEHLGELFCEVYEELRTERLSHPKGSAPNNMLKLALNGVYGMSNEPYSQFYDPQYTMTITINGQLLLCMLAEMLLPIEDLDIIQVNTDGLTIRLPRKHLTHVRSACAWWQTLTDLTLEEVEYSRMFIRDVSNYIAVDVKGNVKHVGAYKTLSATLGKGKKGRDWNQDHGALIVPKAAEYALLNNCGVDEFIRNHQDPHDFTMCTKLQRTSHLLHGETRIQNTSRYYVSTDGDHLYKMMPPLRHKGQTEFRRMAIKAGFKTHICNKMTDFNRALINFDWYIEEARKLVRLVR